MSGAVNITINAANINLTNNNSILTLFDGNINNTTGVDGQGGIINLAHDLVSSNIITGDIGNIGSLAAVNVLLGSATLNSTILKATNINLQSNTSVLNLDDDILQCNGGNGKILDLQGNTTVNSIVFADSVLAAGTISVNSLLDVGGITFNNSNASGGTLIVNTENTINVALLNAIQTKIQINANLIINDPSAGDIGDIRIADNTTYTIDAANGNVNLLK
ncbi:putative cell surface antigen-like protein [Rickettsia parkeri str. Tate's Hell]|uniref:Cell surface antigen-like protein n=1 Tax=Rickettsia parkeri str. Tate's Hell TaxID=1359189 RepID=A0ABR5DN37_RICPA|nr:hypothetical protein [Rickettsia parkeri]KJV93629.1 putative cell surface antigen-like protein [Rickettsia parkeri str. Grand Bay]KJV96664.1 putative cell surface antigen-like protein [Rickettsia parkeri str. AT\